MEIMKTMDVWIELQEPDENYTGDEICDRANKMLKRLGGGEGYFQFSPIKQRGCHYRYIDGPMGGITNLEDNGRWFNLNYFGREKEEDEL